MKIGYIILCHKEPKLVAEIAERVTKGTENIAVIHVDLKSDIEKFKNEISTTDQIIFVENRVSIYWGGFSSIEATMTALQLAMQYNCDRYVLLQGCDYPLHTNDYIAQFFEQNKNVEFLKAYNVTKSNRKYNYMKCFGYHIYDGIDRGKKCLSTYIARSFTAINKLGVKYRKGYYQNKSNGEKYDVYWGWGHFAITHECAAYILSIYMNDVSFNRYFKHIFPVDETYLQTIVYNSPFKNMVRDGGPVDESNHQTVQSMLNLTYFEYPKHVIVFNDPKEVPKEVKQNYIYIRKVSLEYALKMKGMNCLIEGENL